MRKKLLNLSLFFVISLVLMSSETVFSQLQSYKYFAYHKAHLSCFSLAINVGSGGVMSDLQKLSHPLIVETNSSNISFSANLAYRFSNFLSLRAGLGLTSLQIEADKRWENRINYPIKTPIVDLGLVLIHDLVSRKKLENSIKKANFYMIAGVGAFYFSPYNMITGERLSDSKNSLSGAYPLIARQFIFGGGIAYHINNQFSLGWECTFRYTDTDYLDSTNPKVFNKTNLSDDHFLTFGMSLHYVFKSKKFQGYNYSRHFKRRHTQRRR